ncbi:hypothetical protein FIBSPDRAFT_428925 [Athelia psychrophila]|uniref:Uncharacterized protein n=1 Tax=Athelia psychrophila TaxID=1759441 RepID=A0A166MJM1_9AGAM|nr:hypothetical protein FIBSPDRAFT_428925 [Fibularhizoctonia sp. CBS 109695]
MHSWRLSCGGTSWDLGSTERDGVRWAYCEQNTYVKSPQKSQLTPWLETRSGVPCTVHHVMTRSGGYHWQRLAGINSNVIRDDHIGRARVNFKRLMTLISNACNLEANMCVFGSRGQGGADAGAADAVTYAYATPSL